MVPSWVGAELVAVHLSRVSSSSFEGCDVEQVQEWVAQCHGMTLDLAQHPHNAGDGHIVAAWWNSTGI
jgi:hypothetical protein